MISVGVVAIGVVAIASLNSLSGNNWPALALAPVDSFPLRMGHNLLAFPVLSTFGFSHEHCDYDVV